MANEAGKKIDPGWFNQPGNQENLEKWGIDKDRAKEFIEANPGDYDRIRSALWDDEGKGGPGGGNDDDQDWNRYAEAHPQAAAANTQAYRDGSMQSWLGQDTKQVPPPVTGGPDY